MHIELRGKNSAARKQNAMGIKNCVFNSHNGEVKLKWWV